KEVPMKKYLVLYRSAIPAADRMKHSTPEQMKEGMDAWMKWAHQAGTHVVDLGSPLQPALHGHDGGSLHVGGFSILQGETPASIDGLLKHHPHLNMPGNTIEVHEFLPMPGM